MDPVKRSISFAVFDPEDPSRVLEVLRPEDDPELPDLWGLPAGSLRPGESWEDAVLRAGREKLGVELEVGPELNRGSTPRSGYTLEMRLFEARVLRGEPSVPQPFPEVSQYRAWKWGPHEALRPAAERGSLCCRLFLERG